VAWRGVHLSQPARLSLADGQIVIGQDSDEVRLPIEDVAWIVLDTPQATLSTALIAACMNAGMVLVTTDRTHTPSGIILPFHRHHRQAEMAALQAALSAPLKKRLWQLIVQRKIANQAALLEACGADARPLRAMVGLVGSGDADNVEARAARSYWSQLFTGFVREDASDKRNMLLNYGYAVIRSGIARALVAVGLVPAFGINHASVTNAFNLADDLVEPFRPFVDRLVWGMTGRGRMRDGEPSVGERRTLAAVLLEAANVGGETVSLLVASEKAAESLVRAMERRSTALLILPRLNGD
jgi:CRISPR-associated protein Cas1